jgi:aminobenzoyl-glutamate utilization protein A
MSQTSRYDHLVDLRRDLHRRPEPAWREFYTTARILEEVERIGVDELHVGEDALSSEDRAAVPDDSEIDTWFERARDILADREGSDPDVLDPMAGGHTGAVAVLERGEGPTIGLRVDIDGLPRPEADDESHVPAAEGFRSETGAMHACGHDAHATFGVGVLEAIADSDFSGTFKLLFQPAEEVIGGGRAMAKSGHLDDIDYLLAAHIGLSHPTGEVVAGIGEFLAVTQLEIEFTGESAHAGAQPQLGNNANQAVAAAVQNLYAIPRHEAGGTRINAGVIEGGSASNIVAEQARVEGEVRGDTTALRDYMLDRAYDVVEGAATMHGCEASIEEGASAPSAESDPEIADTVADVADGVDGVDSVVERAALGGSEDATYLMKAVQDRGGKACYVGIGTDHPGGHHTATFDVDEASLPIGVDVLAGAVMSLSDHEPTS